MLDAELEDLEGPVALGLRPHHVIQRTEQANEAELVYVTHLAKESAVRAALQEVAELDVVNSVASVIRVEDL